MTAVSRAQQHSRLGCRAVEQPWQESPTSRSRRRTDAERGDERAAQRSRRSACTARGRTGLPARRAARELAARQSCPPLAAAASVGTASTAPQPTGLRQTSGAPARPDRVRTHSRANRPHRSLGLDRAASSRRRSPCCCLRPCAHAAHRHTPNRKIETLRGGVDPVSRTSDGLRRPAAKGSCLSCREPVPPLRRSSVVRRSSCCAPDGRRASCLRAWASLSRRCATGVARTRSIAMSVTTVSRAMSALSWRGCGARTRGSARSATCSSEPRPFFATESGTR